MIRIENVWTGGFKGAIRSMRNPYESHGKSDSLSCDEVCRGCFHCPVFKDLERAHAYCVENVLRNAEKFIIGKADMDLCKRLVKSGPEHRKFLRMIHVQADITAPRYWWAEMDKYKWVEANSSSTMHLITKRYLTDDDFSCDGGMGVVNYDGLNILIQKYRETTDADMKELYFRTIKQRLPESYNQLRTLDMNYEALLSIYWQRHLHRLTEWKTFCDWVASLPYMQEFLDIDG